MARGPWGWLPDPSTWSDQAIASVVVFALAVGLFYIISLFVRHAIETSSGDDPAVGLRRGRIATAIIMVVGLLVAGQTSGLLSQLSLLTAGFSLVGTVVHVVGMVVAAALIAAGLAAGFGARDVVASSLLGAYLRSKWGRQHGLPGIGADIAVGDIEGELTRVSPLYAHIRTPNGATVLVPTARIVTDGIRHRPDEAEPSGEPPAPAKDAPDAPTETRSIFD